MSLLKKIFTMRNTVVLVAAVAMIFGTVCVRAAHAQDSVERKVKSKIAPQYPEIARKLGLSGTVRLEVVIAANGTVKETKVIGGHPILVTAAEDAVKKWKFEPASGDTTGTLEFKFEPGY